MNKNENNNDNKIPYTNHYMIHFEEALQLISDHCNGLGLEQVELSKGGGRILAETIVSPISIPPFDNSAMDGYAVNYENLVDASPDSPVTLKLIGLSAAGDNIAETSNTEMTAWKIMTGAPVPAEYNAIIPVENTKLQKEDSLVVCYSAPSLGAHIRQRGEDFIKGHIVLEGQQLINANRMMALSSLGVSNFKVVKKPNIAVFSTGKELIDDPSIELKPGQIRNSNMPYILEYLKTLPVDAFNAGTNYDDIEAYQLALQQQLDKGTDIIISTGAVSMGDFDFIPQTIIKMGGEIIFHKIKIRPGKPLLFARFPNGSYYFGLPGNPISATIGLRFFVTHLINLLLAMPVENAVKTKLKGGQNTKKGFTNILKAHSQMDNNACLATEILTGQESFKIHPMLDANGWVVLSEQTENVKIDDIVDFYPSHLNLNN